MKKLALIPAVAILLLAGVASAQTYYPTYSGGCVILASDLSYGSRGSDVTKLQEFLVSQNYPGGGSWMITGYFGQATVTAVRNFQQIAGIAMTGFVDAQTRSAISARTCGGIPSTPTYVPPSYTTPPVYPSYPPAPYPYSGNRPVINSLSNYTGTPGMQITVFGSNFDQYSNTVQFGPSSVVASSNAGTELTFWVPALTPGSYQVSVSNARGVSNSMTFTVTVQYGGGGCGFGQPCPLSISYLTPSSGAVGSTVTIYGRGFSQNGNTINFGQGIIANLRSFDGTSLSFTVPSTLIGYGTAPVVIGTYPVSVTNAYGERSNTLQFQVTSLAPANTAPIITSVEGPNSLPIGTSGTWTLRLNAPTGSYVTTSVVWGDEGLYGHQASVPQSMFVAVGQVVTFTHTYHASGTYTVRFTVSNNAGSNSATATVVVGSQPGGNVNLSYIVPQSGRVGTQIVLIGSGFHPYDNTVHFGIGGMRNVPSSNNGTIITYMIPSYVSLCDIIGPTCRADSSAYIQPVTPGSYQVYVSNASGQSAVQTFTVTQ